MSQNQLMMVDETLTFSVEHDQLIAGAAAKLERSSHINWELPIESSFGEANWQEWIQWILWIQYALSTSLFPYFCAWQGKIARQNYPLDCYN